MLGMLLVSVLIASVVTVLTAVPAFAGQSWTTVSRSSWAYTDSTDPFSSFTEGDAPVGAWQDADGEHHISKAYFTFDLTPFHNSRIFSAEAWAPETSVADCSKERVTELWRTDVAERPQWSGQPAELVKQAGPGAVTNCAWERVGWDVTATLNEAIAVGATRITLVLRMPEDRQGDLAYGRRYANNMSITVAYNNPPNTPTGLAVNGVACDVAFPVLPQTDTYLTARYSDPQYDWIKGRVVLADVNDPTRRWEGTTTGGYGSITASVWLPSDFLVDGATYEWTARTDDGDAVSPSSPPCRFSTDFTAPKYAPGVSSSDYPENGGPPGTGGGEIPGRFTFTANGDADVVAFDYVGSGGSGRVPADQPGGSATVDVKPRTEGAAYISVQSVDRAGNRSPASYYQFWVRTTTPVVTSTPADGGLGVPREFTFSPRMEGVAEYTYRFNAGPETVLPAGEDGTAKVTLTPDRASNELIVWSRTRDGVRSATATEKVRVDGAQPDVFSAEYPELTSGGGVGITGTFTFGPKMTGVISYEYWFQSGAHRTVTAAPDGTATMRFTPTAADYYELSVVSITATGIRSEPRLYLFFVNE